MAIDWPTVWTTFEGFGVFVLGMVIYSIAVFKFYKKASKKVLFEFDKGKLDKNSAWKRFWQSSLYWMKFFFLTPIVLFVWLVIITALLLLFTSNTATETILLIGMALLATIRITAYYNEDLAVDVAKTLPLSMLAAFLLDVEQTINLQTFWDKLLLIPTLATTLLLYFIFIVLLEFILRIYDAIVNKD